MIVTDEQWDIYWEKYRKLIYTIARRISGDNATASFDDNVAYLSMAALDSIKGFKRKTGKDVDAMLESKLFDQYTKTCLWNAKNTLGDTLVKRYSLNRDKLDYDKFDSDFLLEAKQIPTTLKDLPLTQEQRDIIEQLRLNPNFISVSGRVKIKPLAEATNLPRSTVVLELNNLRKIND